MTETEPEPDTQHVLARLRADLLGGRGPGATDDEVARHTRDRPTLGAVAPAVELAIAAGQTGRARAGSPLPARHGPGQRPAMLRVLLTSAAGALALRAIMHAVGSTSARSGRRAG